MSQPSVWNAGEHHVGAGAIMTYEFAKPCDAPIDELFAYISDDALSPI